MKRYLFIISRAPYTSNHALEQLEAAMVAAAFDGDVHILLRDEGVWALQDGQYGPAVAQKTLSKVLTALPSYEINELCACASSIAARDVTAHPKINVNYLDLAQQTRLISESDVIITGQP